MSGWKQKQRQWLLVAAVAAAILVASVVDLGPGAVRPGPLGLWPLTAWAHVGGYAALTLVTLSALPEHRSGTALVLVGVPAAVVGYGALIELLQVPLSSRTGTIADAVTNGVGAIAVVIVRWAAVVVAGVFSSSRSYGE